MNPTKTAKPSSTAADAATATAPAARTTAAASAHAVPRLLTALLGGYAFAWSLAAAGTAGLVAGGVDFHEAETALMLLAVLAYLLLFIWAFASPRMGRVWAVLGGGTLLMVTSAWALQRAVMA